MNVHFHYKLDHKQESEWTEFWQNCKHSHAQQHVLFGEVERAKGRIPIYITGKQGRTLACIAIFSIRPFFTKNRYSTEAICLRGPAFDDVDNGHDFFTQIITYFKGYKVGAVRVSPYWMFPEAEKVESLLKEFGFFPFDETGHRSSSGLVDLKRSNDEILKSFSNSTRYQIRLAGRCGVSIRPAESEDKALLAYNALSSMRQKRGLNPMPRKEFDAMYEYILKGRKLGILLNAFSGSTFLGCLWIARGPYIAIPLGYTVLSEEAKKLSSNLTIGPLLWFEGMKWASENGCISFDVEGYSENTDPKSYNYQVNRFKSRLKPVPVQRIHQHIYICNNTLYSICRAYFILKHILRFINSQPFRFKKWLKARKKGNSGKKNN